MTSKPDVLAVAKLQPFYQTALESLYTVHDRTHVTDPAAFADLAPRIVGVAGTGEASVPSSLLAQLPNAKVVSVFGVGYDGVDVPAAIAHGIPVTHTPDVLTDDVADLAMGLVLSVGRGIPQADQFVRAGRWPGGPIALARKVSGARMGWGALAKPLPSVPRPLACRSLTPPAPKNRTLASFFTPRRPHSPPRSTFWWPSRPVARARCT